MLFINVALRHHSCVVLLTPSHLLEACMVASCIVKASSQRGDLFSFHPSMNNGVLGTQILIVPNNIVLSGSNYIKFLQL